jgi:SWI/SNF-related matrix-associated actin-dependent regulator 1 of chromatin subfamily A
MILQLYQLTARAKVVGVCNYLDTLLDNNAKFLVFGHHMVMLDAIETHLKKRSCGYVRIDGQVNPKNRHLLVEKFQKDVSIRCAVLSITAASQGLTLTAASSVVFAEVFWTPAILIQAEDRAHRIGQKNSVNIHYLYAPDTLDDHVYKMLQKK